MTRQPRKYRNVPVMVNGQRFASKAEARRHGELTLLARAGKIRDLVCQVAYPLHAIPGLFVVEGKPVKLGDYVADFSYDDLSTGRPVPVVEDVKSPASRTQLYRWKKKHFELEYQIAITEIEHQ